MRSPRNQQGFAMILLIGIVAALAILATMLVVLLANEQGATFKERASKTSQTYAEAGLNSAIAALESDNSWLTTPYTNSSAMNTNYATLPAPRP